MDDACPLAEECVVSAIKHDFAVLASPNATEGEKLLVDAVRGGLGYGDQRPAAGHAAYEFIIVRRSGPLFSLDLGRLRAQPAL